MDAATRGYSTLLLEQHDFGKGTSSRSVPKLACMAECVTLEQGNVPLVMEALKERGLLRRNAPHIVSELACIVPSYTWWEGPFYGIGLKLYQLLAGKYGFGKSHLHFQGGNARGTSQCQSRWTLTGGVVYYDAQFDDTRLLINLMATAAEQGATVLNYAKVTGLNKGSDGIINGLTWQDAESGETFQAKAKVVVNATGEFSPILQVRRVCRAGRRPNGCAEPGRTSGFRPLVFAGEQRHPCAAHKGGARDVCHSLA